MTTHTTSPTITSDPARRLDPARTLPVVLEANAATSIVAGLVGLAASRWTADRLGLAGTGWVQLVAAGLVVFALGVVGASRLRGAALARAARLVSAADAAWVVGTVVLVAASLASGRGLSSTGVAIASVMGLGVADFAVAQLWLARRLEADPTVHPVHPDHPDHPGRA